jgi:prephenate dehydratase
MLGYLGPKGSYSEKAVDVYVESLKSKGAQVPGTQQVESIFKLFNHLETDPGMDQIIVPWENSIEGPVNETLDLLIKADGALQIIGEIILPIHHALLAVKGYTPQNMTEIRSHPQALAQCVTFIRKLNPDLHIWPTSSTSEAAQSLHQAPNAYAIGHPDLATLYELEMVADTIQDNPNNRTRFVVVSQTPLPKDPSKSYKTALVFSAQKDTPGSLVSALQIFATRNINLTSITSRPAKTALGEYWFWIDLEGHQNDPSVQEALTHLKNQTTYVKILGSYPKGDLTC